MKKIITISLILIFAVMLIADQREDLQFAVGLYRDKNFDLAKVELKKFLTNSGALLGTISTMSSSISQALMLLLLMQSTCISFFSRHKFLA